MLDAKEPIEMKTTYNKHGMMNGYKLRVNTLSTGSDFVDPIRCIDPKKVSIVLNVVDHSVNKELSSKIRVGLKNVFVVS